MTVVDILTLIALS